MSSRKSGQVLEKDDQEVIADARGRSLKLHIRALGVLFLMVAAVIVRAVWLWAFG